MSLKIQFVEEATKPGAKVAKLCREYSISRETGYKWLRRFKAQGADGLEELSRRPKSTPLSIAENLVLAILEAREAHPSWGPRKLVVLLERKLGDKTPSRATVARILERFGKVRKRRATAKGLSTVTEPPTVRAEAPNDVWTVDFKGWWKMRDGNRCEPLTVRDAFSRFILCIQVLPGTGLAAVKVEFEKLFKKYGVPLVIKCDNGTPFISSQSRGGLTRLSVWWVSLGIKIERSRPASPQDNGGHERMHRDMSLGDHLKTGHS